MSQIRIVLLTALAMVAFAGNSLLCRIALKETAIDPASFTSIRLLSGALMLVAIVAMRSEKISQLRTLGSWRSAFALFIYAAGFSFAYVSLPTASGALLLFGAVQATMIGHGLWAGERLRMAQVAGLLIASSGLVALLLPNVSTISAVPLPGALMMVGAGVAWGIYSLRAKGVQDPTGVTAGNFVRALPFAAALSAAVLFLSTSMSTAMSPAILPAVALDRSGVLYAIASGAITSGLGYALWYAALRGLKSSMAATVQLSAPMLAAIGGAAFLGEALTLHLLLTSAAILGGIALFIWSAAR
jgi:drug/metabolite transporter (DMT)-like permease